MWATSADARSPLQASLTPTEALPQLLADAAGISDRLDGCDIKSVMRRN
jgi:hypothetical protein